MTAAPSSLDHKKVCPYCGGWWWSFLVLDTDDLICEKCEREGPPPGKPISLAHVPLDIPDGIHNIDDIHHGYPSPDYRPDNYYYPDEEDFDQEDGA